MKRLKSAICEQREDDRRQDEMLEAIAEIEVVAARYAGRGQLNLIASRQRDAVHRECELHHQCKPEDRHGLAEKRRGRNEVIQERVVVHRRDDPGTDR